MNHKRLVLQMIDLMLALLLLVASCSSKPTSTPIPTTPLRAATNTPLPMPTSTAIPKPAEHPLPPGLESCIRNGFSARRFDCLGEPVFELGYAHGDTMQYGRSDELETYSIPDGITFEPFASFEKESETQLLESEQEYENMLSVAVEGDFSTVGFSASGYAGVAFRGRLFEAEDKVYALNFSTQSVYRVRRHDTSKVTAAFKEAVSALPEACDLEPPAVEPCDLEPFYTFFDRFGTHYLLAGPFGGFVTMETSMDKTDFSRLNEAEVKAGIEAAYDGLVASGSLKLDMEAASSAFLKTHEEQTSVHLYVTGGQHEETVQDYIKTVYDQPVLLLNGHLPDKVELVPLSQLEVVSDDRRKAMNQALASYLGSVQPPEEVRLLGAGEPEDVGIIRAAPSDGFLFGYLDVMAEGDRGYIAGKTESGEDPQTVRAGASVHHYATNWIQYASLMMPVRKDDIYVVGKVDTWIVDPEHPEGISKANLSFVTFAEDQADVAFGDWIELELVSKTPQEEEVKESWGTKATKATSDGFVVCHIESAEDGDRGYVLGEQGPAEGEMETRAASSMHYWTGGDRHVPLQSFCMPVRKDSFYAVRAEYTWGAPEVKVFWIPIAGGLDLFGESRTRQPAMVYQARSDGFLVGWMHAIGEGHGTLTVLSDPDTESLDDEHIVARASVQWKPPGDDFWLTYNSVTVPIQRGSYYKVNLTHSGDYESKLLWVPLEYPE